jgi:hypothetical protein
MEEEDADSGVGPPALEGDNGGVGAPASRPSPFYDGYKTQPTVSRWDRAPAYNRLDDEEWVTKEWGPLAWERRKINRTQPDWIEDALMNGDDYDSDYCYMK